MTYTNSIIDYDWDSEATSSQTSTIADFFNKQRSLKRPKSLEFNIKEFKKLILNFVISNNLSFRTIDSKSFRDILEYLKL